MLILGVKKVEKFFKVQRGLGNSIRWDGWDLVFFRPVKTAMYDPTGVWDETQGSYGYETRVTPDEKGLWRIDFRNVKRSARPNKDSGS